MISHSGVRGSVVSAVIGEFVRHGGDGQDMLTRHGLSREHLAGNEARIPLARYVAMLEDMARAINDPLFGARLGSVVRPLDLGPAGMVVSRSRSISAALERLTRFLTSFQPDTQSALTLKEDQGSWTYRLSDAAIWPRRQDAEFTLSSLIQLIRSSFQKRWRPLSVQFEHSPSSPEAARELERLLGCPVRYETASNAMMFSVDEVSTVFRDEDRDLMAVLESYLADLTPLPFEAPNWTKKVLTLIATRIGQQPVTLELIAADLAIAPRSLQRRLAEEGVTLRHLLREHRLQIAEQQLQAGVSHLGNLAETLGYADGTTFWRAHRNWKGVPPSAARTRRQ